MVRFGILVTALAVSAAAGAQQPPVTHARVNADAARDLFERDWVLMNWALKFYDADRNMLLSPSEAQMAADAFRSMADTNGDGRVTRDEYRAARTFILARY